MGWLENSIREGREADIADVKPNNKITQTPEELTPEAKEKLDGYQDAYRDKKNSFDEPSQDEKGRQKLDRPSENEDSYRATRPDLPPDGEGKERLNDIHPDNRLLEKRQPERLDAKSNNKITQTPEELTPEAKEKLDGYQDAYREKKNSLDGQPEDAKPSINDGNRNMEMNQYEFPENEPSLNERQLRKLEELDDLYASGNDELNHIMDGILSNDSKTMSEKKESLQKLRALADERKSDYQMRRQEIMDNPDDSEKTKVKTSHH